ncbi:Putative transcriptional regulator [Aminobacter aminovorans]|uniref:Transcriptional regulator n=2 Tax=Aminobacter aminovorans TaxID=83263 RepID=A0AAC8YP88_AMIAI|nr:Putative transcriptional regulator [Aminobacter aminovorans]
MLPGAPEASRGDQPSEFEKSEFSVDYAGMKRFAFVLARDFTLSPLSLFVDTLRLAGDEGDRSRRAAFDWQIIGELGLPIRASSGIELMPTAPALRPEDYDNILVVGGLLGRKNSLPASAERFVEGAARKGVPVGALCTGSFVLAEMGLLDGHRASVSWFHIEDFRSRFPDVDASCDRLFIVDGNRATCSGGAGAADLAAHLVSGVIGEQSAAKASRILLLDRVRDADAVQPNLELFPEAKTLSVRRALLVMESNLQEPLAIVDVARSVGVSTRQLDRDFASQLGTSPARAYLKLRISLATRLLSSGKNPVGEVAFQSGFANAGHFSRVFRKMTGLSPTEASRRSPAL